MIQQRHRVGAGEGRMSSQKQVNRDRDVRLAAMRTAQRRKEQRRLLLLVGGAVAVALVLVGAVSIVLVREQQRRASVEAAAAAPIEGVQEYPDLPRSHVAQPVAYEQVPPVGGDHAPVWTNCAAYEQPTTAEQSVHSLEHGAVWVTYRPDLPADQVTALTALTEGQDYALLSPFEGLPSPVVASAWGVQLAVDDAGDPRLEPFLTKYLEGEQTPEPGAACFGGVDG